MVTAVGEVAAELGVSRAQVALAWVRARSPLVHPLIGPRTVADLDDNLGALDVALPAEAITRLTAATDFDPGFPTNFIAAAAEVFGDAVDRIDGRLPVR